MACFDELKFEISGSFNFDGHGISLDLSSQVPVFKVPLKFKSRDFGACLCHHQRSTLLVWNMLKALGFRVRPCLWHPREPMWRMKQRFPHVLITTCQILQPVWRSIEVILCWKGPVRMSAVVPRQNAPLDSRETGGARRKWWTCWWKKPVGCTGEVRMQWPNGIVL